MCLTWVAAVGWFDVRFSFTNCEGQYPDHVLLFYRRMSPFWKNLSI